MKRIVGLLLILCMAVVGIGSVHLKKDVVKERVEEEIAGSLSSYDSVVSRNEVSRIYDETAAFEKEHDNLLHGTLKGVYECYDSNQELVGVCVETYLKNRLLGAALHLLVEFNPDGKISRITILSDSCLPGEAKSVAQQDFLEQFYGIFCRYFSFQLADVSTAEHVIHAAASAAMTNTVVKAVNLAVAVRNCQYPDFSSEVIIEIEN